MDSKKLIYRLLIINLVLIIFYIISKLPMVLEVIHKLNVVVITPIVVGVFFFYLIKPLNEIFLKKKIKPGWAAMLSLIISCFIICGAVCFFGKYFIREFRNILQKVDLIINNYQEYFNSNPYIDKYVDMRWVYGNFMKVTEDYMCQFGRRSLKIVSFAFNMFSTLLLIVVVIFYLLKDGGRFKEGMLKYTPEKYKDRFARIMTEGNKALSCYVTGQAKVALSLATMIYIGYLIIGMPSGVVLASATFILAFIPFVGFFISMIIPYIIAISIGLPMVIKLTILFMVAQGIKGRVVVPAIMSKAMHIHPITNIFVVIAAASIIGPLGAFVAVPIYSLLKIIWVNMRILTLR